MNPLSPACMLHASLCVVRRVVNLVIGVPRVNRVVVADVCLRVRWRWCWPQGAWWLHTHTLTCMRPCALLSIKSLWCSVGVKWAFGGACCDNVGPVQLCLDWVHYVHADAAC